MKSIAALALISIAFASEGVADNELMNKQALMQLAATNPELAAQIVQAQAQQPHKSGDIGKWAGRNKEWLMPVGTKILDKVLAALDDEELFVQPDGQVPHKKKGGILTAFDDEELFAQAEGQVPHHHKGGILKTITHVGAKILPKALPLLLDDEELFIAPADNELMNKALLQLAATNPELAAQIVQAQAQQPPKKKGGIGKWAGRNKEWLEPVGTKLLDKVLAAFDDEELFVAPDNELMNKKALMQLAATNPEMAAQIVQAQAQLPPQKKGGIGKWAGRNKEWLMPVGTKLLDKVLAAFDDEELFVADNEFAKKGSLARLAATNPEIAEQMAQAQADGQLPPKKKKGGILKTIAGVGAKILPKALPLLLVDDEELFAQAEGQVPHHHKGGILNTIAHVGAKILPKALPLLLDDEEQDQELFNLGGLINNGLNVYKDVKTHNYGGLVNDGIQIAKDIKKHDDEELFNLGGLINDGLNIYKDVKTHNYGGLVNDGIQTVKDVKQALPKKKFLGH